MTEIAHVVENRGGAPSFERGTLAQRPAPDQRPAGAMFLATDTEPPTLFVHAEGAWVAVGATGDGGGGSTEGMVPDTLRVDTTAPVTGGGRLNQDLTLGLNTATPSRRGSMSAADKAKLDGLTPRAVGAFMAYASGDQSITTNSFARMLFQVEEHDTDGWFANSRYAPQREGYYDFSAMVTMRALASGARFYVILHKNGTRYKDMGIAHSAGASQGGAGGSVSRIYANGTTDYFDVRVFQDAGADVSTLSRAESVWFSGGFAGTV